MEQHKTNKFTKGNVINLTGNIVLHISVASGYCG